MKHLDIDLKNFHFYQREKINGKRVHNRCGRDFLYYAFAFYHPDKFGVDKITAYELEHQGHLGLSLPAYLAWTQMQFLRIGKYLKQLGLSLEINNKTINSYGDFVWATANLRISYENAISEIEDIVEKGEVAGVDVSIGWGGLLDHVMFVYGYDDENLYIFETTDTPIKYESISNDHPQVMKLAKSEIRKRWSRFGRVWRVYRS